MLIRTLPTFFIVIDPDNKFYCKIHINQTAAMLTWYTVLARKHKACMGLVIKSYHIT